MPFKDPEQKRAYQAARHVAHREEDNARSAAWRAAHPEEERARRAAHYADHQEEEKAKSVAYYANHPEERKAYSRAHYATHPEEVLARNAAHRVTHPEVHTAARARRAARKKGLPATLTAEQWLAIQQAYKHCCAYCGKKESKKHPLTQDHVIPLSKGGGTTPDNIVPACGPCNSRKHAGPAPSVPAIRLLV